MLEDNLKPTIKPQYVDHIPRAVKGNVGEVLSQKDERGEKQNLLDVLGEAFVLPGRLVRLILNDYDLRRARAAFLDC